MARSNHPATTGESTMSDASGQNERNGDRLGEESGIIVFGGGGGRGCLSWIVVSIVLSVILTILANLILFSGGGSGVGV
jgi:hypothetical protein